MPLDLTPQQPPYYTIDQTLPPGLDDTIAGIYRARINQTSTNNPTAIEATNNTLSGIVWTYVNVGTYIGTLTGSFPINKTFITSTPQGGPGLIGKIQVYRVSDDVIQIDTFDNAATDSDGILTDWNITITITN